MRQSAHCPQCGAEQTRPGASVLCHRCLLQAAMVLPDSEGETRLALDPADVLDSTGRSIGPYRLVRKLGEGGMGVVYLAEQSEPVQRRVALKLVKWGMDTRPVVARFQIERQALALMEHPTIARVFDGGATERGRPYFVMEYVKGIPITQYCDRECLDTRQRLELFGQICEGVQHAHQKGVIHRDLKPTNILVEVHGGRPLPKIIDFGVAKATALRLTERSVYTQLGELLGTPEYMSPEQAELTPLDVDTRTDVYSLGVLLYELLVGRRPFDFRSDTDAGYDEIRRRIREEEPAKPSTRLNTLGREDSTQVARLRRTDLKALRRRLRGDLDWIALKALEKDRTRRYGSAAELGEDIRRHLRHEPVAAGPPGVAYRAGKFARRHRAGVVMAAASVVLLLGFAGTMAVQARRIATERDTATTMSDYLVGLFEVSDPSESRGEELTARELLDRGAERIERELADQPEIQARMMATIGGVYGGLGYYEQADALLSRALEIRRGILGDDHPDTITSITEMALNLSYLGRLDDSERYHREALDRARRTLDDDDEQLLQALNNMGLLLSNQGKFEEAEPYYREVLAGARRVFGEDHRNTLTVIHNLGLLLKQQGKYEEAAPYYHEALEGRRRILGEDHPLTVSSMKNLAQMLKERGQLAEAEPLIREALEITRRVLGDDHDGTLAAMNQMGDLLQKQGKYEEAEPYLRAALDGVRRTQGEQHPSTLHMLNNMGLFLAAQGKLDEAEPYYLEALERRREVLSDGHPDIFSTIHNLGALCHERGDLDRAESYYLEAAEGLRGRLGDEHPRTEKTIAALVQLYEDSGDVRQAARWRAILPEDARSPEAVPE